MALLLSLSMAAGMLPVPALATTEQPAVIQAATPEQAAPAATAAPEVPETEQSTAETAAAPAPVQAPAASQVLALQPQAETSQAETGPAVGDTITIDGIKYEVDRLPTETANGQLTLTDGKSYSGALVLADGIEYAGGKYDVTELAANAFSGNTVLTSIDMTDSSVKTIGQSCFRDCTALSGVQFSANSVTNMQKSGVFSGCTSLTRLSIPSLNLSSKYSNSPFAGSSIQELTVYNLSSTGIKANLLNNMPDGFTLNLPGDISSTALVANTFGSTKNVTLNLGAQEDVEHYKTVFDGKGVTVQLFGGEEGAQAIITDSAGGVTGYATLNDAINAINQSEGTGPFRVRTINNGSTTIEWTDDVAPNKATVIDFAGASVDLPDTLTLQAPLTIENITNINPDEDTLTTLIAGSYAFAMVDGGSFGFAEIRGSDLTFAGTLPGGQFGGGQDSRQVQLTGTGDGATVTFVDVGRSGYYYVLPNMAGFDTLVLDGAYLEADGAEAFRGQLDDVTAVELQDGGLKLNDSAEIESLSGNGELRFAEGAALTVTGSASGSFRLPEFAGTELADSGLSLPLGSDVTLTNANGETVTLPEPVVQVEGLGKYATMAEAFAAITADAGTGIYTLTLQKDVTLEGDTTYANKPVVTLPAKALVIDGNNHKLCLPNGYVDANADLTLKSVELDMASTYLRVSAEGATVTVEGTVTGELEKIDANAEQCNAVIYAPVSDDIVDAVGGTSGKVMTLTLKGYGSQKEPADTANYPTINIAGSGKGTLILENSWLVNGTVANWGNVIIRKAGGLAVTRSMQAASPSSWTVEEGAVCKGRLGNLRLLYRLGVRMLTLTWNFPNELGWPNVRIPEKASGSIPDFTTPDREHGLTETGFDFLEEMERLGMIVDVSHLSDAGFWDVARTAKKPFVASHSNARAVCGNVRNLDDDMIRALAEKGGVTGLNFCTSFLEEEKETEKVHGNLEVIAAHARHIVNIGGEDCLGLGSDFDGIQTNDAIPDTSCLPSLADALEKAGFSGRQIDKIFCENVLRVYREILK